MTVPVVDLQNVRAGYGDIEVLHGVSLRVARGQMLAILGPNGAGKSTLLKAIAGLLEATAGDILLGGEPIAELGGTLVARAGVRLVPDAGGTFPNLTVTENLRVGARTQSDRATVEELAFTRFPKLATRRSQLAGTLSGGEQQMLAVARALAGAPQLLLLDELSSGLAPLVVSELLEHVRALTQQGVTVIVVEQFARAVLPIADHAGILVKGQLQVGSPGEIQRQLQSAYLGRRADAPTTEV